MKQQKKAEKGKEDKEKSWERLRTINKEFKDINEAKKAEKSIQNNKIVNNKIIFIVNL